MASKMQALILILLPLLTLSLTIQSSQATNEIVVYWGQNNGDGTLSDTCSSGNYDIVVLAFLNTFGCGRTPSWNFAGHCGDWSPCTKLEPEIKFCQSRNVKVFLSLGGAVGSYGICSEEDAKQVAQYLHVNFLSGQYGPLGGVTLDGIDFDIEGGSNKYWDVLARELNSFREQGNYFYLSAAPQCFMPDYYLDEAIKTGYFDKIFVQFYNNPPCQFSNGNSLPLLSSYKTWTSYVPSNSSVFIGLPAAPDAAPSGGYISPADLQEVLEVAKQSPNFGGVMLWDRYRDVQTQYSTQIRDYVLNLGLQSVTKVSDAIYQCVSAALHRVLPKAHKSA